MYSNWWSFVVCFQWITINCRNLVIKYFYKRNYDAQFMRYINYQTHSTSPHDHRVCSKNTSLCSVDNLVIVGNSALSKISLVEMYQCSWICQPNFCNICFIKSVRYLTIYNSQDDDLGCQICRHLFPIAVLMPISKDSSKMQLSKSIIAFVLLGAQFFSKRLGLLVNPLVFSGERA